MRFPGRVASALLLMLAAARAAEQQLSVTITDGECSHKSLALQRVKKLPVVTQESLHVHTYTV